MRRSRAETRHSHYGIIIYIESPVFGSYLLYEVMLFCYSLDSNLVSLSVSTLFQHVLAEIRLLAGAVPEPGGSL